MNELITSIGSHQLTLGIAAILTIALSIVAISGFVVRFFRFMGEGGKRFGTNIKAYRQRIRQTATFAADDDAYLDALLWMKLSRIVTLVIAASLCLMMRNLSRDGMFNLMFGGEELSSIAAFVFLALAIVLVTLTAGTLYEISRISRIAVEKKDRIYFPERYDPE